MPDVAKKFNNKLLAYLKTRFYGVVAIEKSRERTNKIIGKLDSRRHSLIFYCKTFPSLSTTL